MLIIENLYFENVIQHFFRTSVSFGEKNPPGFASEIVNFKNLHYC